MDVPARGAPPDFVAELIREVRSFVETLTGFARHPVAFSRSWVDGERAAMNPIGFFGAALGVRLAAAALLGHFQPPDPASEAAQKLAPTFFWAQEMLSSQLPLVRAALFASVVHWRMRAKGSRVPFRGSLGIVLYVWGLRDLARAAAHLWLFASPTLLGAVWGSLGIAFLGLLAVALAGAHRLRRWTAALGPLALGMMAMVLAVAVYSAPVWVPFARDPKSSGALRIDGDGVVRLHAKGEPR
jgi:hypothetical protein